MKKIFFSLFAFCIFNFSFSQKIEVYPSNWWVGMKWNKVQLMLYGKDIGHDKDITINYPGVIVKKISGVENSNYLFIDIDISSTAKPGKFKINVGHNSLTDLGTDRI